MPDSPQPQTRGQKRIAALKAQRAQIEQALKDAESRIKAQARKDETARKIEAGALALHHMRENPDSEFAAILLRLLNRYVPQHRRRLFSEFGISPDPPPGPVEKPATKSTLKDHFPG
jgi:hypothetical protein